MIDQIVEKAVPMAMQAKYEAAQSGLHHLAGFRFVVNPETEEVMQAEMLRYNPVGRWIAPIGPDGLVDPMKIQQVQSFGTGESQIYGITVITDPAIPVGEVELRAIMGRSW